ncbi:MAG TPA: VOC family protein [Acidimicrobiia bacterium]|jgi:catechol 2,3-dioxygenase-like lactoylglutathione lyase family enzyme
MGQISGIGQIHISVDDLDQAVAWYRDVLGLDFLFQVPGQPMAFFDCGGVRLYLGRPENESFRSRPILYYQVDSIDDAHREIGARGAVFGGEPHVVHNDGHSELWMCFTNDPEGNAVALMEERHLPGQEH